MAISDLSLFSTRSALRRRAASGTVAVVLCAVALAGDPAPPTEAARILRFLADDARAGRGSFTDGNREAARFIAAEFAAAGLRPFDSSGSFLRPFDLERITPETLAVVLDGAPVPPGDCLISTELPGGAWTLSDSFPARRMGETFDRELLRGGDGIVLVPRSHRKMFERYRRFAARPRLLEGAPEEGAVVAVLTDSPAVGSASVTYRARIDRPVLENVVGTLPGRRPDEVVLISAHYDHLGVVTPVNGDSIANGADDDASGVTAMLLLARKLAAGGEPERTLVFAAFAGEEIGGFGARRLLSEMEPDGIVAMANLEMLGKESKFGPRTFWITGYDRSTFGPLVSARLAGSGFEAHPDPYPEQRLFYRSDNAAFARAGVPAHTFSTTRIDVDSVYHTVEDEFERIDTGHLAAVAGAVGTGLEGVISGEETPSRIPREPR